MENRIIRKMWRPFGKSKKDKSTRDKTTSTSSKVLKNGSGGPSNPTRLSPLHRSAGPGTQRTASPKPTSPPNVSSKVTTQKNFFEELEAKKYLPKPGGGPRPSSGADLTGPSLTVLETYESSPASAIRSKPPLDVSPSNSAEDVKADTLERRKEERRLELPPLRPSAKGRKRKVVLTRRPEGGFGIKLSLSTIPDPTATNYTRMGFLIESRQDESGLGIPLVTGDVLMTVNGVSVEGREYKDIVEVIKHAGHSIEVEVACLPELTELSERGALEAIDDAPVPSTQRTRESLHSSKGRGMTSGTLRRARSKKKTDFKVLY